MEQFTKANFWVSVPQVLPPRRQPRLALILPYPSWDLKDGLDEGQLGEKVVWPACLLLLVTLPWGRALSAGTSHPSTEWTCQALRGAAVDEHFRQPVVVSVAPRALLELALGGPHLGWQEGSFLVRPVQAVQLEETTEAEFLPLQRAHTGCWE